MKTLCRAVLLFAPLVALACGSSSDDTAQPGAAAGAALPAEYDGLCTGTLLTAREYATPGNGPSAWVGGGEKAPAGTKFLLGYDGSNWGRSYFFLSNGTPAELDADFTTGLMKGVDFSSDCAEPVTSERRRFVVLRSSTLFATEALDGAACVVEGGTAFTAWGFSSNGAVASFQAKELEAKCGYAKGYTKNLTFGTLVAK